jgi:hypothetical protein
METEDMGKFETCLRREFKEELDIDDLAIHTGAIDLKYEIAYPTYVEKTECKVFLVTSQQEPALHIHNSKIRRVRTVLQSPHTADWVRVAIQILIPNVDE